MGKRFIDSTKAVVAPYSSHMRQTSVYLIGTMVILASFVVVPCQGCKVEQCWHQYSQAMNSGQVTQGPNGAYCAVLKAHSECIRATARSCRGDLKYHSTSSLVLQWNNEYNCSYIILHAASAPPVTRAPKTRPIPSQVCAYHGRHEFQHCALFGDPHLRTFSDEFQTCKVLGAWPLINNPYIAVQVTNEAVLPGSSATATTKITVIIKGGESPCAHHKTYEAQVDNLPPAFNDGTQSSGADRSVRIKEKEPGSHVEIFIRYIATTVVVRQVRRYLTLAVRMPKDIVSQAGSLDDAIQLCMNGCPHMERIDYKHFLVASPTDPVDAHGTAMKKPVLNPVMSRDVAVAKCKEFNVTDFYFDSCVFDLITTGDTGFGQAANKALHDLRVLNPDLLAVQENRTVLPLSVNTEVKDLPGYRSSGSDASNSAPGRTQEFASARLFLSATMPLLVVLYPCLRHLLRCLIIV